MKETGPVSPSILPLLEAAFDKNGRYINGSILEYCGIRYSGGQGTGAVTCTGSSPYLKNITIDQSASNGIGIFDSDARIEGCTVKNCTNNGIFINNVGVGGIVQVANCLITDNRLEGIDARFTFGSGFGIFANNTLRNNGESPMQHNAYGRSSMAHLPIIDRCLSALDNR